jgi:hypothetical protein
MILLYHDCVRQAVKFADSLEEIASRFLGGQAAEGAQHDQPPPPSE